jgi:hypothetical protein
LAASWSFYKTFTTISQSRDILSCEQWQRELMKMNLSILKRVLVVGVAAVLPLASSTGAEPATKDSLIAHEWGTFTSVQGPDGKLLQWKPLETSALPKFVHDWQTPGPGIRDGAVFTKGGMGSLQRMETPVIYFYANTDRNVDVSVTFPNGRITEWYPQASAIGPSMPVAMTTNKLSMFSCGGLAPASPSRSMKESGIAWNHLHLTTTANSSALPPNPLDASSAHYFAARETDSMLAFPDPVSSGAATNKAEKFLFYRGVGNFATPLQVSLPSDLSIALTNSGAEALADLFVLHLKAGRGSFEHVKSLPHGKAVSVPLNPPGSQELPKNSLAEKLSAEMAWALQGQGLYPKEASAMVKTWESSWFSEDGIRVLYILPRPWTDKTLPLTITPVPNEVARVMVGRAEVLSSQTETILTKNLVDAAGGNVLARDAAVRQLRGLGRFAEPAFYLTLKGMKTNEMTEAYNILGVARTPANAGASASL